MATPKESHSRQYCHINGGLDDLLDRFAVTELCKGWPVYRDASEWMNYRALFAEEATVWTTWSGPRPVDEFIAISKAGKAAGAFIQHRECGTLAELNRDTGRAVGKMKATITQRFKTAEGIEYDVDCDCRFIFFCQREGGADANEHAIGSTNGNSNGHADANTNGHTNGNTSTDDHVNGHDSTTTNGSVNGGHGVRGAWKARYVKLIYEKDRVVPADGQTAPRFSQEELDRYPEGYRYLGSAQARLGYDIDRSLSTVKDQVTFEKMYSSMEKWLAGEDPGLFW